MDVHDTVTNSSRSDNTDMQRFVHVTLCCYKLLTGTFGPSLDGLVRLIHEAGRLQRWTTEINVTHFTTETPKMQTF